MRNDIDEVKEEVGKVKDEVCKVNKIIGGLKEEVKEIIGELKEEVKENIRELKPIGEVNEEIGDLSISKTSII